MDTNYFNNINFNSFRISDDNDIYEVGYKGETKIGVTNEKYNKLYQTTEQAVKQAEEYYNMLVEHKIITPPPKQEDVNIEILNTIKSLSKQVEFLNKEVMSLKQGVDDEYISTDTVNKKSKNSKRSKTSISDSEQYTKNN